MSKNERIDELLRSAGFGLILFFGAVFSLLLNKDMEHLKLFSDRLFLIMGIYILGTVFIRFFFSLSPVRKMSVLFSGAASIIWIFAAVILLGVLSSVIEDYMRNIFILHLLIIAVMFIGNYLYMRYISMELNQGAWKEGFKLVVDLPHKPKDEDEFMSFVYSYATENALELEVLYYGMPAKIRLNNELNEVSLQSYMSFSGGVIYTLEFKTISE